MMDKNENMTRLRIILRSLIKNKSTSAIIITGFSISISIVLVLIAFLINEFSVDKGYPNIDHIYRVFANGNMASVREDFREYFLENYPDIEDACRYNSYQTTVTSDDIPFTGQMIATDSSFFNIFSSNFLIGNASYSLSNPNDIVLTESFARRIFGNEDPIGKTLIAEYKEALVVSGIIEDFPDNSSIHGDFITNSKTKIWYEGTSDGQGNRVNYFRLFCLTDNKANIPSLEELLTKDISYIKYSLGYPIENIILIPFSESYFMQGINRSQTRHANLKLIKLLLVITSVIILLAVFNYINLTTASFTDRYKEIAVKKTIGASRRKVFLQFISESVLVCFISFLIALLLSSFWVPLFEKFIGSSVNLKVLYEPVVLACVLIGVLIISVLSGIYPASVISGLRPINIFMKRGITKRSSFSLRGVLNIIQNAVSVTLIISLIVITRQIDYVRTKDFGFDTDKLLRVDVHWRLADKTRIIRDKLLQEPTIKNVCFSHGTPGSIYSYSSWEVDDKELKMNDLTVDSAFFDVFRIPIVMGRELLPSDFGKTCYINETAFKTAGWDTFEGQKYHGMEIIGVVKDFHLASMYNNIEPVAVAFSSGMGVSHMTLRVDPINIPNTINALTKVWKEVCPGHELKYQFYDDWLDSMYKSEERLAAAIRLFAVLAIMISCLGIIGIAEFAIKKRTKEIGLRKVHGARISQVMVLLNMDFIRWVFFALFIALPLSYFILNKWLETFAYRASLSWWIFTIGGVIAVLLAFLTVSWQSWRAATRNPVKALRYE
jgi:putative ABC transport system permease protein